MKHLARLKRISWFIRRVHLISGWGKRFSQPRPQGFSLEKWVGREKALASAGHVYSLNIPRS